MAGGMRYLKNVLYLLAWFFGLGVAFLAFIVFLHPPRC